MNTEIRKLEDDIVNLLNSSNINIETKRLVVSNIYFLVREKADQAIVEETRGGEHGICEN